MPALAAMLSVEPPSKPCSANSSSAAARISSRRSAWVFLVTADIVRRMLVMTHKFVKRLRDPVELALGQPRVERERQGVLVGMFGPGEEPLVAVGAEQRQGIGADLRLDPLRPERGEDVVAALDL